MKRNTVIVGGGPAGAFCGYNLARKGIDVSIIDNAHPREKPCGGGLSSELLRKFPIVEEFISVDKQKKGSKQILGKETMHSKITSYPPGYFKNIELQKERRIFISRKEFDQKIVQLAEDNGAELIKDKVIDIVEKKDCWKIITNKKTIESRIIVGADGVNSVVRKKGLKKPLPAKHLALTYGYYCSGIENEPPTISYVGLHPTIKFDYFLGYIWIFPGPYYSTVGIGGQLIKNGKFRELLHHFLSSPEFKKLYPNFVKKGIFSALVPSAISEDFFDTNCAGEKWILIGDAAGHVDPISGEGILYALWSASLAAECITKNQFETYDKLWRKEYGKYLRERCSKKIETYKNLKVLSIMAEMLKHKQ